MSLNVVVLLISKVDFNVVRWVVVVVVDNCDKVGECLIRIRCNPWVVVVVVVGLILLLVVVVAVDNDWYCGRGGIVGLVVVVAVDDDKLNFWVDCNFCCCCKYDDCDCDNFNLANFDSAFETNAFGSCNVNPNVSCK